MSAAASGPGPNFSFAELIQKLGHPPVSKERDWRERLVQYPAKDIFEAWVRNLPKPFVPGTSKKLFRLLFPHEGSRRRYDIREIRLAAMLEEVTGITGLTRWDAVSFHGGGGTGCLGEEVKRAMLKRRVSPTFCQAAHLSSLTKLLS